MTYERFAHEPVIYSFEVLTELVIPFGIGKYYLRLKLWTLWDVT